jgi:hypothetical protein
MIAKEHWYEPLPRTWEVPDCPEALYKELVDEDQRGATFGMKVKLTGLVTLLFLGLPLVFFVIWRVLSWAWGLA